MKCEITALTVEHLDQLLSEPGQESLAEALHAVNRESLCQSKEVYACVNVYGQCVAAGGLVEFWPGRCESWVIFSQKAGPYMLGLHRQVKKFLCDSSCVRIEATVSLSFPSGIRWLEMLGFKKEAPCLAQYREGQDYALYSLIRGKRE